MSQASPDTTHPAPSVPVPETVPAVIRLGSILAWVGVLISLLLVSHESGAGSFLCPARGGCEVVLSSRFAVVGRVPLPIFGAIFYVVQLGLWLAIYAIPARRTRFRLLDAALWLAIVGATFSAGLMFVQFGVLRAFCPLCTASALTTFALVVVAIRAAKTIATAGASPGAAVTLAIFALLPAVIFLVPNLAPGNAAGRAQLIELSPGHRVGPANAAVQVNVFSDFQCGYCAELAPTLARLAAEFPQEVSITYRHFPLAGHPRAFDAAVAAECAAEQDAFQSYSARLYAEGGKLTEEDFLALAAAVGLDQARFAACLRSAAPRRVVEAHAHDALRLDLDGVPVVFINGRRVRGALDYESLGRQIRAALPKGQQKTDLPHDAAK